MTFVEMKEPAQNASWFYKKGEVNMKHIYFYLLLSVGSLFLSSCVRLSGEGSESLIIAKSAIDTKEKQRRERERSDEINRGDCKDYGECEDVCEDVYNDEGDRENEGNVEECLELPYKRAITFQNILDIIEEPYYADLTNIEAKDFEAFLEVSVAPWVEKKKRLNNEEAENLLKWIASESKVADAISNAYDSKYEDFDLYEGMQQLFEEVAPDLESDYPGTTAQDRATRNCAEYCSAVSNKVLAQNQSFWDIVSYSNNSVGLEIACSILRLKCRYDGSSNIGQVRFSDCPTALRDSITDGGCGL